MIRPLSRPPRPRARPRRLPLLAAAAAGAATTRTSATPDQLRAGQAAYEKAIAAGYAKATKLLDAQLAKHPKKPTVVLDIDETTMSNWGCLDAVDFDLSGLATCVVEGQSVAFPAAKAFIKHARAKKVAIAFITGAPAGRVRAAQEEPDRAGHQEAVHAHLPSGRATRHDTVVPYKSAARKALVKKGATIVLNVGDQKSDLSGGAARKTYMLPNPIYVTAWTAFRARSRPGPRWPSLSGLTTERTPSTRPSSDVEAITTITRPSASRPTQPGWPLTSAGSTPTPPRARRRRKSARRRGRRASRAVAPAAGTRSALPPPSPVKTASSASSATSPSMSPVARGGEEARGQRPRARSRDGSKRGRPASTCRRARDEIWRQLSSALADDLGDLVVGVVEHLAQQEDRALDRREALQQRRRNASDSESAARRRRVGAGRPRRRSAAARAATGPT